MVVANMGSVIIMVIIQAYNQTTFTVIATIGVGFTSAAGTAQIYDSFWFITIQAACYGNI